MPRFWSHDCPVQGTIGTASGEPCPWCDTEAADQLTRLSSALAAAKAALDAEKAAYEHIRKECDLWERRALDRLIRAERAEARAALQAGMDLVNEWLSRDDHPGLTEEQIAYLRALSPAGTDGGGATPDPSPTAQGDRDHG